VLVTRRDGRLTLITQPDHAALAGRMAASWGNEHFATPAARDALICAAVHHDDGWRQLDSRPTYNAERQRPAHFTELPLSESAGPYARNVESVYERDLRAGALVGMHFSGFYTNRWGVGTGAASESPLALQIVAEQEARWMPALRAAWGNRGLRSEFDAETWHAYEVLQAVDLLSLALGLMDLERPADGEPVDVTSTLTRVDQAPGARMVTGAPRAIGDPRRATITVQPIGPGSITLDPYPFRPPELQLAVPVRELEDRPYESAEEAAEAFHAAEPREMGLTLSR
jgi:Protein of unknown function (DUF3891)